jgi:protein-histidine pros-kinase
MSDELFRGLLEAAPDAIVVVDGNGAITLVNRQTEQLFGYERHELIGLPMEALVPQRFHSQHVRHRDRYLAHPRLRPMGIGQDLYARRKDGSEFPVEISLSPLRTPKGPLVFAAVRDITDRKRADEQFRGLLEAAPDAMVIVGEHGDIALVNRQTERLFGYDRGELVGRPVEVLVPEQFRVHHANHRDRYMVEPRVRAMGADLELFARRKDGTEFPVEISLSPLLTPKGTLVSAAIRDITDRRAAEEAMREALEREQEAAAQLRELDALKDEFLATVSHEMRTPLAAIVGFSDVLLRRWADEHDGDERALLERVASNAQEMNSMVEQLLDFSRLQAGRVRLEPRHLDVSELVHKSIERLGPSLSQHELVVDVADSIMAVVDPDAVAHVLRNLLTNAAKYSDPGSTIRVRAQLAEGVAVMSVEDSGVGIPADEQALVFDRFFRASTAVAGQRGTGVGLSIARRYVELQGGRIWVESEMGRGSSFFFTLPLEPGSTEHTKESDQEMAR